MRSNNPVMARLPGAERYTEQGQNQGYQGFGSPAEPAAPAAPPVPPAPGGSDSTAARRTRSAMV